MKGCKGNNTLHILQNATFMNYDTLELRFLLARFDSHLDNQCSSRVFVRLSSI